MTSTQLIKWKSWLIIMISNFLKLKLLNLRADIVTRFESTYFMLNSIHLKIDDILSELLDKNKLIIQSLNNSNVFLCELFSFFAKFNLCFKNNSVEKNQLYIKYLFIITSSSMNL